MKKKMIRHLSLFTGCGGMDIGLRGKFYVHSKFLKNFAHKNSQILLPETKIKTVFCNDIKKESYKFWKKNFFFKDKDCVFNLASIVDLVKKHKIEKNVFPNKIDLVTGGFPCQDFSVSGLRKGFSSHKSHLNDYNVLKINETRGNLYLWMKEVINITQPKMFIAENVKGLISKKEAFEIIKKDFEKTGTPYRLFTRELYAPDYGIPQSRRRIFFVGINENFIKNKNIKINEDDLFPDKEFQKIRDLKHIYQLYPKSKYFFTGLNEPYLEKKDLSQKYYSKAKYIKGRQGQTEVDENGIAPTIRSEHHGNIEFRFLKKKNNGKNKNIQDIQRRLTVRECARIQTFSDNLEFVFGKGIKEGISASVAYKLIGDAVPPLLAYKFGIKIEKFLTKHL